MKIVIKDKENKLHEVEDFMFADYSKLIRNCLKYSENDHVINLPTIECETGRWRRLSCGEVFDPATGQWSRLPQMNRRRSNYSLVVTQGQLMVLGGSNQSGLTETTEILDEKNMKWVYGRNMIDATSATASCTVSYKDIEPEVFQKYRDFCAP